MILNPGDFSHSHNINLTKIKKQYNQNYLSNIYSSAIDNTILAPSHPNVVFDGTSNILNGSINDFTLIMNSSSWLEFKIAIDNNNATNYLKRISIYNPNISLDNNDWINIENDIIKLPNSTLFIDDGYAACINVIKNKNNIFQISYTNLNSNDSHNMQLPDNKPWLKAAFIGDNNKNYFYIANSQFTSLLTSYIYSKNNWDSIQNDSKQNPNNYSDWKNWFYHTYIICDSINISSDSIIWKSNEISQDTVINYFDQFCND